MLSHLLVGFQINPSIGLEDFIFALNFPLHCSNMGNFKVQILGKYVCLLKSSVWT